MKKSPDVRVMVLRAAGTNCDRETAFAFAGCGANVEMVHINAVIRGERRLEEFHIMAIPGGFSYGDDIAAGKILANELRLNLAGRLSEFIGSGKLIIGICNGFQVLAKSGILPGFDHVDGQGSFMQPATLTYNDSGKFEDRWVHLKPQGKCVWTEGMSGVVYLPVAHGEGKFVTRDKEILRKLNLNNQVVFRYCRVDGEDALYPDNPNGAFENIAGITDPTGRVLGLMPHPERHFSFYQHPFWTRLQKTSEFGDGAKIFENGVRYVRGKFLSRDQ